MAVETTDYLFNSAVRVYHVYILSIYIGNYGLHRKDNFLACERERGNAETRFVVAAIECNGLRSGAFLVVARTGIAPTSS